MIKPKIICIVGESGSGKTTISEYIEKEYDIPMIQSHTERPIRYKGENGHQFHDNTNDFDKLKPEDKLAETTIDGFRYWCETKDVTHPIMTYVIDESGLVMFREHYNEMFNIIALRITRDEDLRLEDIGEERFNRDVKFFLDDDKFDYILDNHGSKYCLYRKVETFMRGMILLN